MATDLSGATVGELQVQGDVAPRADLVTVPDVQPNMTVHDPVTFAALTGQRMLEAQHAQNLLPTPDDIKAVEAKALEDANNYHRTVAEQAQKERGQLGARQAAVTRPTNEQGAVIGPSIAEREEAVRTAAAEQKEQWGQGPGAVAQAQQIQQAGGSGKVAALSETDQQKLDAITNGYDAVNNLQQYFNKMMEKPTTGVGGQIRSLGGAMHVFADATSPEALAFSRAADAALVPIGRGVMGETGASPTKESMIELAKTTTMPRIQDSNITGNQGSFQLKQRIMQNLYNMRANRYPNIDTTNIDRAIARYGADFNSPEVQKYNPLLKTSDPLVQVGNSNQANAAIANATTGANAGVQVQNQPVQQPQGQAGAYTTPPGYTPPQPPQPSYGRQSAQAVGAAAGGALKTAGSVIGGGLTSTGELSSGLGTTLNWLGGLLPENWPQQAFQQSRPWETTSQQFVGNQ
jgi:hypothetical protein